MAFTIKSDVNAGKNIVVQGKNSGVSITTNDGTVYNTNSAGAVTVPVANEDFVNDTIRDFPLSQYGDPYDTVLNITSSGLNLNFNKVIPLFMGGLYVLTPTQSITLAANRTYNVYVGLSLGIPSYHVNTAEEPETNVNMFIGKVVTNASSVTSNGIAQVSRFSNYRASTTQRGGAFPVSTGHPTQTGTINW